MSPDVWSEIRDAVKPSVAAGQLLPHRAAQISVKYRVDLEDVTRIYLEERDKSLKRTGQPADPVPTAVGAEPAPPPAPKPDGTPRCPHCRQGFDSQQQLSAHLRVHPEALVVPCDLCDVRSISKSALEKHKDNMHKGWRKAKKQQAAAASPHGPAAAISTTAAPQASVVEAPTNVTLKPSLHGLRIARGLVEAFTAEGHEPDVRERAEQAAVAIAVLESVLEGHANALAARAKELRAELEQIESQLAQVQEAAA